MSGALKLYELTQQHRELERLLDGEELPPEVIHDTLEALEGDIEAKATSVAHLVLNLDSFAEQVAALAEATKKRSERIARRAESIRNYLLLNMQATGIKKIEAPEFTIAVRANPAVVEIEDYAVVPEKYMVTPEPPPARPDKKALAVALKEGEVIPGVWLRQGEHLSIKI
jgi:Siphovirus Gp157